MNADPGDIRASSYVSVGPALPYPDLVVWDDQGMLCAVVVGQRIAIYLAESPSFTLLGTAHLGSANDIEPKIQSASFVHGVLYCSTQTSIQCIFLGDVENEKAVCEIDCYTLASISTASIPLPQSIGPIHQQISLLCPSILGYHQGSLLVSSTYGIYAISLSQPLLRIGALVAVGHTTRAQKWIDSIHPSQHECLARFLSRRGATEMAINLPGLCVETVVDLCVRYGLTDHLKGVINKFYVELGKLQMGIDFDHYLNDAFPEVSTP